MARNQKAEQLGKKLLNQFTRQITDAVFLFLENEPALYQEYQEVLKESSQSSVNSVLGKMITEAYGLDNLNKETHPKSQLLKKYTRHSVRWEKKLTQARRKVLYGGETLFTMARDDGRSEEPEKEEQKKKTPQEESLFTE